MALQNIIEQTVVGLGYQLVDIERSAGGFLRITIDKIWQAGEPEQLIQVEDCEKVTRQLQFVLEVEQTAYSRLEVSSPGIDRPLKTEADLSRFCGEVIDITLKAPMGAAAAGLVSANRKKFRGVLEITDTPRPGKSHGVMNLSANQVCEWPRSKKICRFRLCSSP